MVRLPIVVIAGPTASGKSRLALALAEHFGGTIINADSMQVYRELRVITSRPSLEDEARVPHRLFGAMSGAEACSAGRWLSMAAREIADGASRGQPAIVVGGTGLYLKALTVGLAPIPDIPDTLRLEVRALHRQLGGEAFRSALARLDPVGAARLSAHDGQRLIRAYEVVRATGRPLGEWHEEPALSPLMGAHLTTIVMVPPRAELYRAIDQRFEVMVASGALSEVEALLRLGFAEELPIMKAVGVRELADVILGNRSLADAATAAKQASRNLAKRQVTWLRHQTSANLRLETQFSESLLPDFFSFIRQFLLTLGTRPSK